MLLKQQWDMAILKNYLFSTKLRMIIWIAQMSEICRAQKNISSYSDVNAFFAGGFR